MAESFDGSTIRWKPDGKGFLFTSNHNGDAGIWFVDSEGRSRQRITDKKLAAYNPAYSPDGKKIVFFATASNSYGPDIYTAEANGSNLKKLTATTYSNWAPTWSHNGAKLAVVTDAGNSYKLLVVDPKSGKVNNPALIKPLTPFKLIWSPNDAKILAVQGQSIAVTPSTAAKPSEKQIALVNNQTDACWSLDSKSVFFTDWNQDCAGISLTKQDGEKPQQITVGSVRASNTEKIQDQNASVHSSMGLAGPVEEISSETVNISDLYPRLSPDGKLIAFIRDNQVWSVDISGREQRQITSLAAPTDSEAKSDISSLEWSPSGKNLVFQRHFLNEQSGLEFQIWTVELESGEAVKIYSEKVDTEYGVFTLGNTYPPAFTPDGKSILFTSTIDGSSAICTIDSSGQNRKVLVSGPAVFPSMSSNGTQLAYISLEDCRQRLKVLDLVTGGTKDINLSR
jgi:Tol biopolymer transport system component